MKHLYLTRKVFSALFLLLLTVGSVRAQFTTATPDGNIVSSEYGPDARNKKTSSQGGTKVDYYMTWDSNNLYIAVNGVTTNRAVFYFDVNPIVPVNGGNTSNGNVNGYTQYDNITDGSANQNVKLPFRSDIALAISNGDAELVRADGAGNWIVVPGAITGYGDSGEGTKREVAIEWSAFPNGRPTDFNFLAFTSGTATNETNIYAILPDNNVSPTVNNSKALTYYQTINGTNTNRVNVGPAGQQQALFARESYTKNLGQGTSMLPNITLYDLTVNGTNNASVSVARAAGASLTINNDLYIGGNGSFTTSTATGSANSNSMVVKGDLTIVNGGKFTQGTAPLTIGGNLDSPGTGGFVGGTGDLAFNGGVEQTINIANLRTSNISFTNAGIKTLSNTLIVSGNIILSNGARLYTGENNALTLDAGATLTEFEDDTPTGGGYVIGRVTSTQNLSTGINYTFNNIGLELRPYGPIFPGQVTVLRVTGSNVQGVGDGSGLSPTSIFRQYIVTVANGTNRDQTYDVGLTFGYRDKQEDELGTVPERSLRLFRSDSYDAPPYQPLGGIVNEASNTVFLRNAIQLNSVFTLGDNNNPLPVELVAFTGKLQGSAVRLDWATASEKNNKGFEVQRNTGNDQWLSVGFVAGHGSTSQRNAYSFVDANAPEGKASYRLRQLDNDGTESFSPVVTIQVPAGNAPALVLSPVPTADMLTISGLGAGAHVAEVYDMLGKRVLSHSFSNGQSTVSVANLPSGLYVVQVQGKKSKFVKQ